MSSKFSYVLMPFLFVLTPRAFGSFKIVRTLFISFSTNFTAFSSPNFSTALSNLFAISPFSLPLLCWDTSCGAAKKAACQCATQRRESHFRHGVAKFLMIFYLTEEYLLYRVPTNSDATSSAASSRTFLKSTPFFTEKFSKQTGAL